MIMTIKEPLESVDKAIGILNGVEKSLWTTGTVNDGMGNHCALGWLGNAAGDAFVQQIQMIVGVHLGTSVDHVNDGRDKRYKMDHPKLRVLCMLHEVKGMIEGQPENARQLMRELKPVRPMYIHGIPGFHPSQAPASFTLAFDKWMTSKPADWGDEEEDLEKIAAFKKEHAPAY